MISSESIAAGGENWPSWQAPALAVVCNLNAGETVREVGLDSVPKERRMGKKMSKRELNELMNDSKRLSALGEKMYEAVREELEKHYLGQYVMFNIPSGEYVIGSTHSEVIARFRKKFPEGRGLISGIGFFSRV